MTGSSARSFAQWSRASGAPMLSFGSKNPWSSFRMALRNFRSIKDGTLSIIRWMDASISLHNRYNVMIHWPCTRPWSTRGPLPSHAAHSHIRQEDWASQNPWHRRQGSRDFLIDLWPLWSFWSLLFRGEQAMYIEIIWEPWKRCLLLNRQEPGICHRSQSFLFVPLVNPYTLLEIYPSRPHSNGRSGYKESTRPPKLPQGAHCISDNACRSTPRAHG